MKIVIAEYSKGYASSIHKVANELAALGNEVHYITVPSNDFIRFLDKRVCVHTNLRELDISIKRKSPIWLINRIRILLGNVFIRNSIINKIKPDIVNIQACIPIFDQFYIRANKSSKYIMTVHNVLPHKQAFLDKGQIKVWKKQDALIVHTEENRKEMRELYGITKNVEVIHHGVDIEYTLIDKEECKRKLGINTSKKTALFFGAIKEYKGLDFLLEALKGTDIFLLVAGHTDRDFSKYKTKMKENKIDSRCIVDYVPEEMIPVVFQASDFVVLPYKDFHSQSGVLMQSAKYRKPIVATDVGEFKTFIEKYNIGIVVPPLDEENFRKCCIDMIEDTTKYLEYVKGCENTVHDNSWKLAGEKYNDLFRSYLR